MKLFKSSEFLWVIAPSVFCSVFMYCQATDLVESNKWSGFHCQPIQKVETLEEAKARIKQYQAMVRG